MINVAKKSAEDTGEAARPEEHTSLRLAVFPGGEAILDRLISVLENGGLRISRGTSRQIVPVIGSNGDHASYVIEVEAPGVMPVEPGLSGDPLSLAEAEAIHIHRVLESCGGNRTRAAAVLGVARSTLIRKLQEIEVREKHS